MDTTTTTALAELQDSVLRALALRADGLVYVCALCEDKHPTDLHRAIDAAVAEMRGA